MKNKLLILCLVLFGLGCQPRFKNPSFVQWYGPIVPSWIEANSSHRNIVLFFKTRNCHACKLMEQTTLENSRIIYLLNNKFIPVIVDDYR